MAPDRGSHADGRDTVTWETGRIEAFSDGVLAIAITLLVLEISLPEGWEEHLWSSFWLQWPSYLAFVTSFLTIGGMWMAHHSLFVRLKYADATLMQLNLGLLLAVSFLPFPTSVLADALHAGDRAQRIGLGIYGVSLLIVQAAYSSLVRYAISHPELHEPLEHEAAAPPKPQASDRRAGIASLIALGAGVLFVPKVAAITYLIVAGRGIFVAGGRGLPLGFFRRPRV
jgi:uncharacterized membrane protein